MQKYTETTNGILKRHARDLFSSPIEPLPVNDDILILNSKHFNHNSNSNNNNKNNNNSNSNSNNNFQHTGKINAVKWIPKNSTSTVKIALATASMDGTVFFWNIGKMISIGKKSGYNSAQATPYHRVTCESSVEKLEFTNHGNEMICLTRVMCFILLCCFFFLIYPCAKCTTLQHITKSLHDKYV